MTEVINLLKNQKKIELSHVETLKESMKDLNHPMARVIIEAIIHDSRKHAAIAQALIEVDARAQHIEDDRVKAFIDYWISEEKRHHQLLNELSNLIDRDSVSLDEYVGLFQKYKIVPLE